METEKVIKEVLHNFDFEKVHKVMATVNWEWEGEGIPSVADLVLCAYDLLRSVSQSDVGCTMSTGGFEATKNEGCIDEHELQLQFVLEQVCIEYS